MYCLLWFIGPLKVDFGEQLISNFVNLNWQLRSCDHQVPELNSLRIREISKSASSSVLEANIEREIGEIPA